MALRILSSTMTFVGVISFMCTTVALTTADIHLCVAVCRCESSEDENVVKADCSRAYLSIVPPATDWPINITHLDLSFNNISTLDFELAHDTLEVLDLSHNHIGKVVQNAFGGLTALKYLNLASNGIKQLEDNGFYGLDHLKSLNLSSNGMYSLPDGLFYNFLGLQELSLADNPLVHIDPIHFNRMIALRWLDLSNTDLYTLPATMFHTTGQLEFLDLSANEFHEIPTDALRSAKALRHLRFNENPVDSLDKKSFLKLTTLERLELSSLDQLKEIKEETFSGLVNLRSLEMKYNRHLTSIDARAFAGLFNASRPTLQELDLEGNRLKTLDSSTVSCARMRKFNLQKNPWTCDCSMKWIKDCQLQKVYAADLKCFEPLKTFNALIIDMTENDFECDFDKTALAQNIVHHDHVVRTVSVGMAAGFLVILAFGLGLIFKWRDIRTWYRNRKNGPGAVYYVRARANP